MKTVVLANQKGGVGKSAVATLMAHYLAQQGLRVLALDFDHQANFTSPIALSRRATTASVTSDALMSGTDARMPQEPFVLVPACDKLLWLEREAALHNTFARNFRTFLRGIDAQFDVCLIDTNPNPDIRLISAMASSDFLLSPIQLSQEAMDGIKGLIAHPRVGFYKMKKLLNPKLELIGLLPTLVESTPYQRANLVTVMESYIDLLIRFGAEQQQIAKIPKRSSIMEAQGDGLVLWEMKKTAAREAWEEIRPTVEHLASVMTGRVKVPPRPSATAAADVPTSLNQFKTA